MRPETGATILEHFAGSTWAKHDSKRHDEAAKMLEEFTHEEIAAACKSMRRTLSRSHVKPEELVGEIKRNKRREVVQAQAWREGINPAEVERELREMRNAILLAPAEEVREAVAYCRKVGSLDGQPLSPKREEWSSFTIGMVHAALERKAAP
jgi:CO dehydrogenase/acetyl-CoA synthase alpha subunit